MNGEPQQDNNTASASNTAEDVERHIVAAAHEAAASFEAHVATLSDEAKALWGKIKAGLKHKAS